MDFACECYMTIILMSSNNRVVITRVYRDLIDTLSDIGGIVEILLFIGVIIYSGYNLRRMKETELTDLFRGV